MLSFFLDIMKQKCGNYVTVQLLQTLNILFENIRNETSLYYLLSNNHVNSIILHKFDLSDEEVMAYYISFLKTLSFKLNPHTIHFFFNTSDFPLYTEAIKYFNHPEKMVRIAVRILTLNVFKVDEKSMLKFITGQTVPCLSDLVYFIRDTVVNIEKCLKDSSNSAPSTPQPDATLDGIIPATIAADNPLTATTKTECNQDLATKLSASNTSSTASLKTPKHGFRQPTIENFNSSRASGGGKSINTATTNSNNLDKLLVKIDDLFAEHLDHLHYLNDVLMLKIDDINRILSDNLMRHLVKPLVDAYKDDPHNSMIRLFTLEFTTSILSKVLATSLYEEMPDDEAEENDMNTDCDETMVRLAKDVKDCNDKQDLTNDKLSSAQLAIIEQSKEIAEIKIKARLKTDSKQQMKYLSLFDSEYNDMKRKRLNIDYLFMDAPIASSTPLLSAATFPNKKKQQLGKAHGTMNKISTDTANATSRDEDVEAYFDIDRARYQIRDFLLWRQLLLNIRNEKDRELSLKNTTWLSYAKLLQWLE